MVDFRFLQFSTERAARNENAVHMLVLDCSGDIALWLGKKDLERHVAAYGRHPAFARALAAYEKLSMPNSFSAPAGCVNSGARTIAPELMVPKRIRMKKTVFRKVVGETDVPCNDDVPYLVIAGMTLCAAANSEGEVAAVFMDGKRLYVVPDEFDVIEWMSAV